MVVAVTFGLCAAIALWAFEFGKDLAGLDRHDKAELASLRVEVAQLRQEREKALSVANTAESLLKSESVARERLALELRQAEADNLDLKADLGFFRRLLPTSAADGLSIRALQAEPKSPGKLRYQLLVMQNGKNVTDFVGRYEVVLVGTLGGRPWHYSSPNDVRTLQLRQYLRVEGLIDHPVQAVVKTVEVRVSDQNGKVVASRSVNA